MAVDWECFYAAFREPGFIAGYEIENHLGGGAYGEVYRARKSSIGKPYAIKFLRLDGQNDQAVERELDSVRLFAAIDHPNLVTIEDMGVAMGVPFLVMGYAGDETLAKRIQRADLEEKSALRYFVQACRGVLALHDRRLAHFDLKPGNIFLKGDVARVGDYGLAKLLAEGNQTVSSSRGTPHYMAPEMLANRADHRADIYSLGVILYECLSGELPFGATDGEELFVREDDRDPEFASDFPADLRPVVARMLRLDPADRYGSVHELLDELGQPSRQGDSVRLSWRERRDHGGTGVESVATRARSQEAEEERSSEDVVSIHGLSEPQEVRTSKARSQPSVRAPADTPRPAADPAFLLRAPYGTGPTGAGTIPVPPRVEGGIAGTLAACFVLGAEILGALLSGPILLGLRGVTRAGDRFLSGAPDVPGTSAGAGAARGALRFSLFLVALTLLGGLSAFLVLFAIAVSS